MRYDMIIDDLLNMPSLSDGSTETGIEQVIQIKKGQLKQAIDTALSALGHELNQIEADVKRVADETASLDKALDYAAVSIGCSLMLFDKEITLISYSKTVPVTDPAWKDTMERGYCSFELREAVKQFPYMESLSQGKDLVRPNDNSSSRDRLLYNVRLDNRSVGYLLMIAEEGETLNQFHVMAFQEAAEGVAYAVSRYGRKLFSIFRSNDNHLQMLLSCLTESDIDTVLLSCDFSAFTNMMVLCLMDEAEGSCNIDRIRMQLLQVFPHALITLHKNNVVVLTPLHNSQCLDGEVKSRLGTILKNAHFRAGISNVFCDIRDILQYYRQSVQALSYGTKKSQMSFYENVFIADLLNKCGADQFRFMRHPAIDLLKATDQEKNTNYIETLRTYMENDRNIKKSAAILHVHRNTMIHRIEQIKNITGLDFSDHNIELYIWLSLEMDKYCE